MTILETGTVETTSFVKAMNEDGKMFYMSKSSLHPFITFIHNYKPSSKSVGKTFWNLDEMMSHYKSCRGMILGMAQELNTTN